MSARRTAAKNRTKLPAGRNTKRKVTDGTARGHAGGGYVVTPRTPHALRRRTVHTRRRPLHASVTRRPLHGVRYTRPLHGVCYTASVTRVSNFIAFCELADEIARAEGESLDGHCRLASPRRDEARTVAQK